MAGRLRIELSHALQDEALSQGSREQHDQRRKGGLGSLFVLDSGFGIRGWQGFGVRHA